MFHRHNISQETKEALGRVIMAHRKEQGLTQQEVAEKLGWSMHWVNDIENGNGILNEVDTILLLAVLKLDPKIVAEEAGLLVPVFAG